MLWLGGAATPALDAWIFAGGVAVRRKTDGEELERAGVVYLMQKTNAGWQIATIVIHDADDALGFALRIFVLPRRSLCVAELWTLGV